MTGATSSSVGDPAPVDLRLPRGRGARHPRLPATSSARPTGTPADVVALPHDPAVRRRGCCARRQRVAARLAAAPAASTAEARAAFLAPRSAGDQPRSATAASRCSPTTPSAPRPSTSPTCCAGPTSRTASRWSDMAVLVRSGRTSIPALRRALAAAGVPVEVASDETPLVQEPAVRPLLDALGRWSTSTTTTREHADVRRPGRAEGLLLSPLGGPRRHRRPRAWPGRCGCATRTRPRPRNAAPPSPELLREALLDREILAGLASRRRAVARRPHCPALLAHARAPARRRRHGRGGALGRCGRGTAWPAAPASPVDVAAEPAARLAHRDLDAICALFETAARAEEQRGHTSASRPSSTPSSRSRSRPTPSPSGGSAASAVRLLTAHRSKGLEWRLVVVAHVQEEALARPASPRDPAAGRPHRHATALVPPHHRPRAAGRGAAAVLRRLHPRPRSAWSSPRSPRPTTRASSRPGSSTSSASRSRTCRAGRRGRCPWPGWSASCAARPPTRDSPTRSARPPRARLARLADRDRADGAPLVPAGRPRAPGGGPATLSRSDAPVRTADEPVALSASALAGLLECPAKWFLEREAGGGAPVQPGAGLRQPGARARRPGRQAASCAGPRRRRRADGARRRRSGTSSRFRTPWSRGREREEVRKALTRFLDWHQRPDARDGARRPSSEHARRGDAARRRAGGAARLRRPARARRRRAASWWSTSRPASTHPTDKSLREPPARALPATPSTTAPSTTSTAHRREQRRGASCGSCARTAAASSRCRTSSRSSPTTTGCAADRAPADRRRGALRAEDFPARPGEPMRRAATSRRSARPRVAGSVLS